MARAAAAYEQLQAAGWHACGYDDNGDTLMQPPIPRPCSCGCGFAPELLSDAMWYCPHCGEKLT